jgi:hypothetical protein
MNKLTIPYTKSTLCDLFTKARTEAKEFDGFLLALGVGELPEHSQQLGRVLLAASSLLTHDYSKNHTTSHFTADLCPTLQMASKNCCSMLYILKEKSPTFAGVKTALGNDLQLFFIHAAYVLLQEDRKPTSSSYWEKLFGCKISAQPATAPFDLLAELDKITSQRAEKEALKAELETALDETGLNLPIEP